MNTPYELSVQLPFLIVGHERNLRKFFDYLTEMIDHTGVPNSQLPTVAGVSLGLVGPEPIEDFYTLIYSPAVMGRTLNIHNKNDQIYIMSIVLEQWNTKYHKQHSSNDNMPNTYFVNFWKYTCHRLGMHANDLYEDWLAQRIKTRIGEEVHTTGGTPSIKKM